MCRDPSRYECYGGNGPGDALIRCVPRACSRSRFPTSLPTGGSITTRVVTWAIGQLRREHATIAGLARRLGTSWKTLWRAIKPELERLAADESRFAGVHSLGVDERIWHHVDPRRRGPKELTGMVDLSRDGRGRVRAAGPRPGTVEEGLPGLALRPR